MRTRGTRLGAAMAMLPLALAGCMASAGANGSMGMSGNRHADMDAHAFTSAVDQSEVQQGMLAQSRAMNQAVRSFANRMVMEHTNALRTREARMAQLGMGLGMRGDGWTEMSGGATTSGSVGSGSMNGGSMNGGGSMMMLTPDGMSALHSTLMANPASRPVAEAAPAALQQLQGLSGAAFDRGYVDSQISAHQYALQNMDRMIASGALSPEVMGMMQTMRAAVADHLRMAQQLRTGL